MHWLAQVHPVHQPGHSLQKSHIRIPYSLRFAVRAVALSRTERKAKLEVVGTLRRDSPFNAACPTFCTSGVVSGQLTGQRERERKELWRACWELGFKPPIKQLLNYTKWNSCPGSRRPASPQPAQQLWSRALFSFVLKSILQKRRKHI